MRLWPTGKFLAGDSQPSPSVDPWFLSNPAYFVSIFVFRFPTWLYPTKSLAVTVSLITNGNENIFIAYRGEIHIIEN